MKRKLLVILLSVCCVFCLSFVLSACMDGEESNNTGQNNQPDSTECDHDWGDWTVTQEATCSAVGKETRVCKTDSSHTETHDIEIDSTAHSFGDWTETTPATCYSIGKETRVCKYNTEHTDTQDIEKLAHTVSKTQEWDYNGANHWHNCEVCGEKTDIVEHDFDADNICAECQLKIISGTEGLKYSFNYNSNSYICTGIETADQTDIVIANYYNDLPVTSIGYGAFRDCSSIERVTIPDGVTSINNYAFANCTNLEKIVIPDSVTGIGGYAFYNCINLEEITIPDELAEIYDYAFQYCSSLTSLTIPDSVTYIGAYAFAHCSGLESITIPDGTTIIRRYTFYYSGLTSIVIPNSVTSIGDNAFANCHNLERIKIPDGVTAIGKSAFEWCFSIESIAIPDGVTSIGNSTFNCCSSLESITIPDSVTEIDNDAFRGCTRLKSVYYKGTAEQWKVISLGSSNTYLEEATRYYYSEENPFVDGVEDGNYWHYDELTGEIVIWVKQFNI